MRDTVQTTVRGVTRALTPKQRAVLRNLMRRKFYDLNHPKERFEGRRKNWYPILRRVFIPADYAGNPSVLLLCQYTKRDKHGKFDYCVFSDGLYGPGHWPSDKFGCGNIEQALASFRASLVYQLIGVWPWVIDKVRREAGKLSRLW